jgi:branched-chain amino acid transport system substrate-binding protein
MRRVGRFALIAWLPLALLSCNEKHIVRLGAVLPMSGNATLYGQSIEHGMTLAFEMGKPDVPNADLSFSVVDSSSKPEQAKDQVRSLYLNGTTLVLGGVTSAEAIEILPVLDELKQPLISPSASSPQLSGASPYFFRVFPSDLHEGEAMARFAVHDLKLSTFVILAKQEVYATGIQQIFKQECERSGAKVLEVLEFRPMIANFGDLAAQVVARAPQAVYVAGYAEEERDIIQELAKRQFAGKILTTSAFSGGDTIASAGAIAEGVYFTAPAIQAESLPQVKAFLDGYRKKYGGDPDIYAAHGYDAMRYVLDVVRQGGWSSKRFLEKIKSVPEYPGVTGHIQFDDKGDIRDLPRAFVVHGGKSEPAHGQSPPAPAV